MEHTMEQDTTTPPRFEPGRLRLARELRQLSQVQLANDLGLTGSAVSQFESGATRPSPETLNTMSVVLKVSSAFWTQPLNDTHEGFFRSLRRSSMAHRRRARALGHLAHDVATRDTGRTNSFVTPHVPHVAGIDLTSATPVIEAAAAYVRSAWGVPPGPIPNMVRLLEQNGIIVIRLPLDTADVDAFSLPFDDCPVVVLGSDKNDRARSRFDAAHELGHLVLHGEQVWGIKEVEHQAHAFAAAFLMPENDIRAQLPTRADWPAFFRLKQHWQVSLAALLMRARTLETISPAQHVGAMKALSARGWRRSEPVPLGAPETPQLLQDLLNDDTIDGADLPTGLLDELGLTLATR